MRLVSFGKAGHSSYATKQGLFKLSRTFPITPLQPLSPGHASPPPSAPGAGSRPQAVSPGIAGRLGRLALAPMHPDPAWPLPRPTWPDPIGQQLEPLSGPLASAPLGEGLAQGCVSSAIPDRQARDATAQFAELGEVAAEGAAAVEHQNRTAFGTKQASPHSHEKRGLGMASRRSGSHTESVNCPQSIHRRSLICPVSSDSNGSGRENRA